MALAITFTPVSMTRAQYDEIIRRLEDAGEEAPEGRLYHVCYADGDHLQVTDIWESEATFDRFGRSLMPILQELGVDPGQPAVRPIHNVIAG